MPAINFNQLFNALPNFQFFSLGTIVSAAIQAVFIFAGFALLLYMIFGGFQLMTSGGDPGKIKEGQAVITHGIVGFLIIFTAYWLVQLVGTIFGIAEIQTIFQ